MSVSDLLNCDESHDKMPIVVLVVRTLRMKTRQVNQQCLKKNS